MKIIVGLGNPGRKYQATPHNLGFEVADLLAERWRGSYRNWSAERAEVAEIRIGNEPVLLAKPLTWMNLSGEAARELKRNRPVELADLLVVCDDVNLKLGRLRIRGEGSHGGHNGLRSVAECFGSEAYARLRVGIRPEEEIDDLVRYVLSVPPPKAREELKIAVDRAADAAQWWVQHGAEAAANRFNGYPAP